MSQNASETGGFLGMVERAPKGANPEIYFKKKYDPDPKGGNPRKAARLGNTKIGDGFKFRGRGFIQLTGRENYTRASKALGLDLVGNPDQAAEPEKAAKIAVWYWNHRVRPHVKDFTNVKKVTKKINPGMAGLKTRSSEFKKYSQEYDTGYSSSPPKTS